MPSKPSRVLVWWMQRLCNAWSEHKYSVQENTQNIYSTCKFNSIISSFFDIKLNKNKINNNRICIPFNRVVRTFLKSLVDRTRKDESMFRVLFSSDHRIPFYFSYQKDMFGSHFVQLSCGLPLKPVFANIRISLCIFIKSFYPIVYLLNFHLITNYIKYLKKNIFHFVALHKISVICRSHLQSVLAQI